MPEDSPGHDPCRFVISSNGAGRMSMMLGAGCFLLAAAAVAGAGFAYLQLWPVGLWVSATFIVLATAIVLVGIRGNGRQVISIDSESKPDSGKSIEMFFPGRGCVLSGITLTVAIMQAGCTCVPEITSWRSVPV